MTNFYLILAISIVSICLTCYVFRNRIRKFLHQSAFKLQLGSLRTAIHDADKDKDKTNRKNIVVLNTDSSKFEPVQKRLLKFVANSGKNNNNAALTKYRKKRGGSVLQQSRKKSVTLDSLNRIEKKSLYVTK